MSDVSKEIFAFQEGYFERLWGGRKLESLFAKSLPKGPIGEAWLISDHAHHESVVSGGAHAQKTLTQLLAEAPETILGTRARLTQHGRFPLLLKLLDAAKDLSVQVHPNDEDAARLNEPDVGKTEMWYVLAAEEGSELICGIDPQLTRDAFETAIEAGGVENHLCRFPAVAGGAVFMPAGTVHAIGEGIVIAEIQQNSDITYRVYDWDRVQPDGTLRELHVEKSLEVSNFGAAHPGPSSGLSLPDGTHRRTLLAACPYFAAELVHVDAEGERDMRGESFCIFLATEGELEVETEHARANFAAGEAVLVTGTARRFRLSGHGDCLMYYVPDMDKDVVAPLSAAGHSEPALKRFLFER